MRPDDRHAPGANRGAAVARAPSRRGLRDRRAHRGVRAGADRGVGVSSAVKLEGMRLAPAESEAALVERAQSGDRQAFENLVRANADRLYAVVLRFVGD